MAQYDTALLFTGHMIDTPDRSAPRFPASMEPRARDAIVHAVEQINSGSGAYMIGIASGARGGDILFLECLQAQGLPFRMVLPFQPDQFVKTSAQGGPGDWDHRFWTLWSGLAPEERYILDLCDSDGAYVACNAHMLDLAESLGRHVQLLALWDGQDTDPKPGGTAHFIEAIQRLGGQVTIIDTHSLS